MKNLKIVALLFVIGLAIFSLARNQWDSLQNKKSFSLNQGDDFEEQINGAGVGLGEFKPTVLLSPRKPIDHPKPVPVSEVREELVFPNDLVLGIEINGEARAYPINMLTGPDREIVNDTLGGQRIAATW